MHYLEEGQWKETREVIEIKDGVAVASYGPHKARFAPNLNSSGAIEVTTPDGKTIRSHVLGLAYDDPQTGKMILFSEVKDRIGKVVPPNQVIYEDAFTGGVKADVRLTYTKAGLEQDVILRKQIAVIPEDYGLSSASTRLQVLTEFLDAPAAKKAVAVDGNDVVGDEEIRFGAMRMVKGRAFALDDASKSTSKAPGKPHQSRSVPVVKKMFNLDGRNILVEEVPLPSIKAELNKLPAGEQSSNGSSGRRIHQTTATGLKLPAVKTARLHSKPMETASLTSENPGFVLDYFEINTDTNEVVLQADGTYFVSSLLFIDGTLIIEGGTVVKFDRDTAIYTSGEVKCRTAQYRPAVFTAMDDDTVGEVLNGSSGIPSGFYSNFALNLDAYPDYELKYLRISHTYMGLAFSAASATVRNCQFNQVDVAIHSEGTSRIAAHNNLIFNANTAFQGFEEYISDVCATHLTAHNVGNLITTLWEYQFNPAINLYATNSIFSCVTNWGGEFVSEYNVTNDNANVFQTVGGGNHYLATNSAYRNAGTTDIGPELMAELAKRTTYPPVSYTNVTFTNTTTFSVHALRDTNAPDLGYHYDPLDYTFGGCHANSNITFTAGTAAGWFRASSGWYHAGQGIHLGDRQIASFNGSAEAPCYWARCTTVQENDTSAGYGAGGITGWADQNAEDVTRSPEIRMRFTRSSVMASEWGNHFRDDYGYLILRARDCEFWSGGFGGYIMSCFVTNCLLDRCYVAQVAGWPGNEFHWQNCTFRGREVYVMPYASVMPASFKNCIFDGTSIVQSGDIASDFGFNAYLNGWTQLDPAGSGNVVVNSFDWQTGPLGDFYQPTNSPMIDAGSILDADAAGFYHMTATTNQIKEANSRLDMGYHYVALNEQGFPVDTDGDGIADYLLDIDSNWNGISDGVEMQCGYDPYTMNAIGTSSTNGCSIYVSAPRREKILP
jgi:hypothetical protein